MEERRCRALRLLEYAERAAEASEQLVVRIDPSSGHCTTSHSPQHCGGGAGIDAGTGTQCHDMVQGDRDEEKMMEVDDDDEESYEDEEALWRSLREAEQRRSQDEVIRSDTDTDLTTTAGRISAHSNTDELSSPPRVHVDSSVSVEPKETKSVLYDSPIRATSVLVTAHSAIVKTPMKNSLSPSLRAEVPTQLTPSIHGSPVVRPSTTPTATPGRSPQPAQYRPKKQQGFHQLQYQPMQQYQPLQNKVYEGSVATPAYQQSKPELCHQQQHYKPSSSFSTHFSPVTHSSAEKPHTPSSRGPLSSPLLTKPECWPCDAGSRGRILVPPLSPLVSRDTSSSPLLPTHGPHYQLLYLPLITYRSTDNTALEMALWFSQHLNLPLNILAFIEEQQHDDFTKFAKGNNCFSSPLSALRKVIARFSALLGLRDSLMDTWQQPLVACVHSPSNTIAQVLEKIFGEKSRSGLGTSDITELLVLVDDSFHPGMAAMYDNLKKSLAVPGEARVRISYMAAFDSSSSIPTKVLRPKFRGTSRKEAMTLITKAFGALPVPGTSDTAASSFRDILLRHKTTRGSFPHPSTFDSVKLADFMLNWEQVESTTSYLCNRLGHEARNFDADVHVPRYNEQCAAGILQKLLRMDGNRQENSRDLERILLDMLLTWNVISPRGLLADCHGNQAWCKRFHSVLLDIEMCRLLHMHRHLDIFATAGTSSLGDFHEDQSQLASAFFVDLASILTTTGMQQLLQVCNNYAIDVTSTILTTKEVVSGNTPDEDFNAIQFGLRQSGLLPDCYSCQYWVLCFIRFLRLDVPSLMRIILLEVVRNCVHLSEYSMWPVSYLIMNMEEVLSDIADATTASVSNSTQAVDIVSSRLRQQRGRQVQMDS